MDSGVRKTFLSTSKVFLSLWVIFLTNNTIKGFPNSLFLLINIFSLSSSNLYKKSVSFNVFDGFLQVVSLKMANLWLGIVKLTQAN